MDFDNTMAGYDASTYVEDAVIAIAYGPVEDEDGNMEPGVIDSYVLKEAASGAIEEKDSKNTYVKVDGTKYDTCYLYQMVETEGVDGKPLTTKEDDSFTLYDYNGYVITSVQAVAADPESNIEYGIYVTYKDDPATGWVGEGTEGHSFKIFTAKGEFEGYPVTDEVNAAKPEPNTLIGYKFNEDGQISEIIDPEDDAFNAPLKPAGTLNGYDVPAGIPVFDIYKEAAVPADLDDPDSEPTDAVVKEQKDWAVLGLDDLKAVEGDIYVLQYALTDGKSPYTAILLEKPLVEEPAPEEDTVIGFVSSVKSVERGGEDYATIVLWEANGKQSDPGYTTKKGAYEDVVDVLGADEDLDVDPDDLVVLTLEDGAVVSAEVVDPTPSNAPLEKFEGATAVVYKPDVPADSDGNYYLVTGNTGSELQFGEAATGIDKPDVSKATVYFYDWEKEELSVSSLNKIKPTNYPGAMILQVTEGTDWNIVVFWNDQSNQKSVKLLLE
jgi:hypothetical protein